MKLFPAACAGVVLVALSLSGCTTASSAQANHWRVESVGARITYHFSGYDGSNDGTPGEFASSEASSFGKTLQRRLLNFNPDNPLTGSN